MEMLTILALLLAVMLAVERQGEPNDGMTDTGETTRSNPHYPILKQEREEGGVFLLRKGGNKNFNMMRFHVCRTGKKEQFYTLYQEVAIYNEFGMNYSMNYCGNLSHSLASAVEKARVRAMNVIKSGFYHDVHVDVHKTPRVVTKNYYAFTDDEGKNGIEMKLAKSKKCYYGYLQGDAGRRFWDLWKENDGLVSGKDKIKEAGFWIKKMNGGSWMLFMRAQATNIDYEKEAITYEPDEDVDIV